MTKQYIIRHKATQEQLFTSHGTKGAWKTPGHAKAAFTNTYFNCYRRDQFGLSWQGSRRFDEQEDFEIVEVVSEDGIRLARLDKAEKLLEDVLVHLDNTHGYDTDIWYEIREFLGIMDE